jgi:hypothetical protein
MNDLLTVLFFGFFSFFGYFIYHARVSEQMMRKMAEDDRAEIRRLSQALDRLAAASEGPPRCLACSVSPATAGSGYCQDCRGALNRLKPKGGAAVGGSVSSTAFRS